MSVIIREYQDSDFVAVVNLMENLQNYFSGIDADPKHIPFKSREHSVRYMINAIDDCNSMNGKFYVAETKSDGIIGFSSGVLIDHSNPNPYYDYTHERSLEGAIGLLYVSEKFRRSGVAISLIEEINSYFKDSKCHSVTLLVASTNASAVEFYKRSEMVIVEHKMRILLD